MLEKDIMTFLQDKPALSQILHSHGEQSVTDYVSFLYKTHASPLTLHRHEHLSSVLSHLSEKILGIPYHKDADLLETGITSTADHHGVLTHPFALSANYIRALLLEQNGFSTLTTLSCAGISLSNNSFPRGYLFHDGKDILHVFPLLSLHHKNTPVYVAPSITQKAIQKTLDRVYLVDLPTSEKKVIISFLKGLLNDPILYTLADFDEQSSYINFLFFKHIPGCENIDVYYFSQESVVRELLLKYHLFEHTVISELLYSTNYQTAFKKHFNSLVGAFDTTMGTGTELFWGIDKHRRVSMSIIDGFLVSQDKRLSIQLSPESLKKALEEKQLMPSMALTFIILSFYYGVICGGGYSQVDYLGTLQDAWNSLLEDVSESAHIDKSTIPTNLYLGDFAFLQKGNSLAYGFDLFFIQKDTHISITLRQAYTLLTPFFLRIGK